MQIWTISWNKSVVTFFSEYLVLTNIFNFLLASVYIHCQGLENEVNSEFAVNFNRLKLDIRVYKYDYYLWKVT